MLKRLFNALFGSNDDDKSRFSLSPELAGNPFPEDIKLADDALDNQWVRMADILPIFENQRKQYLPHLKNPMFSISSGLGTKIVNQDISVFCLDNTDCFMSEFAYIPAQDAKDFLLQAVKQSEGLSKALAHLNNRRLNKRHRAVDVHPDDFEKLVDLSFIESVESDIFSDFEALKRDPKYHYYDRDDAVPPPYFLSAEGDVSFHFVLRKGENTPVRSAIRSAGHHGTSSRPQDDFTTAAAVGLALSSDSKSNDDDRDVDSRADYDSGSSPSPSSFD